MQEQFEQYALIDAQIAELETKKEAMRVTMIEHLVREGIEAVSTTLGKFTISKLKKWTYPQAVADKAEEVKTLKARYESTGEATYEEVPSLRFTKLKI